MKTILLSIALPVLLAAGMTSRAEAGHGHFGCKTYFSSYARCGCPVYGQRYICYRDYRGRPVYRHRVLPVRHRCRLRAVRGPECGPRYRVRHHGKYHGKHHAHAARRIDGYCAVR